MNKILLFVICCILFLGTATALTLDKITVGGIYISGPVIIESLDTENLSFYYLTSEGYFKNNESLSINISFYNLESPFNNIKNIDTGETINDIVNLTYELESNQTVFLYESMTSSEITCETIGDRFEDAINMAIIGMVILGAIILISAVLALGTGNLNSIVPLIITLVTTGVLFIVGVVIFYMIQGQFC